MNRSSGALALSLILSALLPPAATAQELRGLVLEDGTGRAIVGALLRLLDTDGEGNALAIADSSGAYVLSVPAPGEYRISTEAFGYEPILSHLLSVGQRESYTVDVVLTPAPIGLPGLDVSADRYAELERGLRLVIGVHPRSLRNAPILRPEIEEHVAKAHGVADLVRWSNLPSITTRTTTDGPCFQWRTRHCVPVYLNGSRLSEEMLAVVPLDMLDMIVIMTPNESAAYGAGAVLLYTAGWIG